MTTVDFSKMKNSDLKLYAQENNIDISGAKTKTDLIARITGIKIESIKVESDNVVKSDTIRVESKNPESSTMSNDDNVVGSKKAEESFTKLIVQEPKKDDGKVALYSEKNLHWSDVGHLKIGYNIVTKEESEKWLTVMGAVRGVREATPEEVATYYGL